MRLSLLLVVVAALLVPILMARFQVRQVPTAVAEIVVGIILGKSGFNLLHTTSNISFLSNLGVMMLLFLSGMEIDFSLFGKQHQRRRGPHGQVNPVKVASLAFLGTMGMSLLLAVIMQLTGLFSDFALAWIILMTIALGVVIATLTEKEILDKPVGQTILLTAVLGEVIPLTGLTIYSGLHSSHPQRLWLLILLLVAAIILLNRFRQPYIWFNKITKSTTQLDVRLAFFLLFALVSVAEEVGAENILGAFLAGMVMKLLEPTASTRDKLTSIGYGFFIPIFFVMTGANLNLRTLFANPKSLMLVPVLVIFFVLAKLPVMLIFKRYFIGRNALAGGFLTVTTITIVLPAVQVAQKLGTIDSNQAGAFILAAVIVCIVSPIVFNSQFVLTKEDQMKQKVILYGANMLTVSIAQQLVKDHYETEVVALNKEDYETYNSEVSHICLIEHLSAENQHAFDCDIFVAATDHDGTSYEAAKLAKAAGVERVILSLRQPASQQLAEIKESGLELYNNFPVRSQMMKFMIEAPDVVSSLLDAKNGLYEAQVRNPHYYGRPLMEWEFIDQITVSRIRRGKQWITPHGQTIIEKGDRLLLSGKAEEAADIRALLQRRD